jgi:DNA-damage-inducible protein D
MEQKSIPTSSSPQPVRKDDPERLVRRARKLYEKKGHSRRWVNRRIGGISARQELAAEWLKRGVADSEQFRELTNGLMRGAFGMDVQSYRKYKGLGGRSAKLRDHMSDLELELTILGETAAAAIHHAHNSYGIDALRSDVDEAGKIVARTREQLEKSCGRPVATPGNEVSQPGYLRLAELAKTAKDMHNSPSPHPARTVA